MAIFSLFCAFLIKKKFLSDIIIIKKETTMSHKFYTILLLSSFLNAETLGLLDINWKQVNKEVIMSKPQKAYPKKLTDVIGKMTLPVYLPSNYLYESKYTLIGDANFYTMSYPLEDNARLSITGDRTFQDTLNPNTTDGQSLLKASKMIEFYPAEGLMSTDFGRNGANYTLLVECYDSISDKRCTDKTFLQNIYNKLIIVGGTK
ncbi:MAG: hypothetical protein KN64_05200 [Sulfurovum sp. AS07-7]|nr:MAG: hypothetical protein KN64_05200 [Sulfurovum sp. AS07-7]